MKSARLVLTRRMFLASVPVGCLAASVGRADDKHGPLPRVLLRPAGRGCEKGQENDPV